MPTTTRHNITKGNVDKIQIGTILTTNRDYGTITIMGSRKPFTVALYSNVALYSYVNVKFDSRFLYLEKKISSTGKKNWHKLLFPAGKVFWVGEDTLLGTFMILTEDS